MLYVGKIRTNISSKRKRSVSMERYIEALVVADHTLVEHFNQLNQSLEYFLLTIMNMVRRKYYKSRQFSVPY